MDIKALYFNHLRGAEFIAFLRLFIAICRANMVPALRLEKKLNALEDFTEDMARNYRNERANEINAELERRDKIRDKLITGFGHLVKGFSRDLVEEKRLAGLLLLKLYRKYGPSIAQMNYEAQSTTMTNMDTELVNDKALMAAVKTLGLGYWIKNMREANEQFLEVYQERVVDESGKEVIPLFKMRPKAVDLFTKVKKHLLANDELDDFPENTTIIRQTNTLITRNQAIIKMRGKNEDEDEDEEISLEDGLDTNALAENGQ